MATALENSTEVDSSIETINKRSWWCDESRGTLLTSESEDDTFDETDRSRYALADPRLELRKHVSTEVNALKTLFCHKSLSIQRLSGLKSLLMKPKLDVAHLQRPMTQNDLDHIVFPGAIVLVKWEAKWAPETDGWSVGIVLAISDGHKKNPNGAGRVSKGWSIVEYEASDRHVHLLDPDHHIDNFGNQQMAWCHQIGSIERLCLSNESLPFDQSRRKNRKKRGRAPRNSLASHLRLGVPKKSSSQIDLPNERAVSCLISHGDAEDSVIALELASCVKPFYSSIEPVAPTIPSIATEASSGEGLVTCDQIISSTHLCRDEFLDMQGRDNADILHEWHDMLQTSGMPGMLESASRQKKHIVSEVTAMNTGENIERCYCDGGMSSTEAETQSDNSKSNDQTGQCMVSRASHSPSASKQPRDIFSLGPPNAANCTGSQEIKSGASSQSILTSFKSVLVLPRAAFTIGHDPSPEKGIETDILRQHHTSVMSNSAASINSSADKRIASGPMVSRESLRSKDNASTDKADFLEQSRFHTRSAAKRSRVDPQEHATTGFTVRSSPAALQHDDARSTRLLLPTPYEASTLLSTLESKHAPPATNCGDTLLFGRTTQEQRYCYQNQKRMAQSSSCYTPNSRTFSSFFDGESMVRPGVSSQELGTRESAKIVGCIDSGIGS